MSAATILVVEDDPANRKLIVEILEAEAIRSIRRGTAILRSR